VPIPYLFQLFPELKIKRLAKSSTSSVIVAARQIAYSKHTRESLITVAPLPAFFAIHSEIQGHYDCMDAGGRATQEAKAETFIG